MKLLRKLAMLFMTLSMCLGMGMAFTACGGDTDSTTSNEGTAKAKYAFRVLKSDMTTPAVGYKIQICTADRSYCIQPVAVKEDGTAEVSVNDTSLSYVIHVQYSSQVGSAELGENDFSVNIPGGYTEIPENYNYNGNEITVVIINDLLNQ